MRTRQPLLPVWLPTALRVALSPEKLSSRCQPGIMPVKGPQSGVKPSVEQLRAVAFAARAAADAVLPVWSFKGGCCMKSGSA